MYYCYIALGCVNLLSNGQILVLEVIDLLYTTTDAILLKYQVFPSFTEFPHNGFI